MNNLKRTAMVMCAASVMAACGSSTDPGNGGITTAAQAQSAFLVLRALGDAVDNQITAPFSGSTSVAGAAGTALVSGEKTTSTSSSSTSSTTSRSSDLQIDFAGYSSNDALATGSMHWFDSYYSRTACSSTSCASSTDHSEAIDGTGIQLQFVSNGQKISDEVAIDASSPDFTERWDVKVTTRAGQVFSFSTN